LPKKLFVRLGVSPNEKIFTTTDERGFFPYTLHPTPSFQSVPTKKFSPPQMKEVSFPTPYTLFPVSPNEKIFTTTDERGGSSGIVMQIINLK
jgi:hypothetical protein